MRSREETKRVIAPYGLSLHDGLWYVVGYCHMRRKILTFALDCRIEGTRELKWWTYHWIPYCEIMAPLELRDEVMREMKEMLKRYENAG